MHTVRNRLASRPSVAVPSACVSKPPVHAAKRHETAPVPRGSMAVPLVVPDHSGLIEQRPPKRRNPKGKKARKAAARLAAAREAQALETVLAEPCGRPARKRQPKAATKPKAKGRARPVAAKRKAVQPEQLPAIPPPPLLEQRLAMQLAPAIAMPVRSEPLVVAEPAPQALLLLPAPEPQVEAPPVSAAQDAAPAPQEAPLPRARALVPARRQGLVDVIAFLLRDSGRRLAHWSARRHKTRAEQAALRRAEARQINLQRELEALDALRPRGG